MDQSEDQLAEATRRIEHLEREVAAAQAELQFFVYAASHDLQQSLRAIGTYSQLLQREAPSDPRTREFTTVLVDAAAQMNSLVTGLLTFSRAGHAPRLASLDLNMPFQTALFTLAKEVAQSGAQVNCQPLPEVWADEQQMSTLFENLIGNALKFRRADTPRVEIACESGDEFHTISLQDNGVGIPPEYQDKVFEPFQRLQGREIPGNGLGLPMCRKIVRAHGGKIWVESDGAQGTTVRFTLPI